MLQRQGFPLKTGFPRERSWVARSTTTGVCFMGKLFLLEESAAVKLNPSTSEAESAMSRASRFILLTDSDTLRPAG